MSNPIDTKVISKLAEILDKSNLTELEYEDEGCRISLSKNGGAAAPTFVPAPMPAAPAPIPAPAAPLPAPAAVSAPVPAAVSASRQYRHGQCRRETCRKYFLYFLVHFLSSVYGFAYFHSDFFKPFDMIYCNDTTLSSKSLLS